MQSPINPVEIKIDPVGKPRMTQSSKWIHKKPSHTLTKSQLAHLKALEKYRAFADELRLKCNLYGVKLVDRLQCEFYIKMPESWSKKKKLKMRGEPHQSKPDIDNICKAVMDSLLKDDSVIYRIQASKYWGNDGSIVFY